ncbi:MAG: thioesterase domain-containing protein, partial [Deltaproteobacteria bacterium]
RGPYVVGGHSFGGLLAYEIALQLKRAGETVSQLILLDAIDIGGIRQKHGADYLDGLLRANLGGDRPFTREEVDHYLESEAAFNSLGLGVDFHLARRLVRVTQSNVERAQKYTVAPYDGAVTFFRARDRERIGVDRPEEPFLDAATAGVSFSIVEGDHWSMLRPPNAAQLWRRVGVLVDRALRSRD